MILTILPFRDIKPHNLLAYVKPKPSKRYSWLMFRVFMAEFIASGIVNLPPMLIEDGDKYESVVQGISMGAIYYVAIWMVYPVSGGHINPLISLILFATRRIHLFHLLIYWSAQLSGTVMFQLLGEFITPFGKNVTHYGMTMPSTSVSSAQALGLEVIISFSYIVVYLSTIDDNRPDNWGMETGVNMALALMFVYTTNIIIAVCSLFPLHLQLNCY